MSDYNRRHDTEAGTTGPPFSGRWPRFFPLKAFLTNRDSGRRCARLLEKLKKSGKKNGRFAESVNEWLSMNLPDVIEYCEERASSGSILKIVNAALDEAGNFGLAIHIRRSPEAGGIHDRRR